VRLLAATNRKLLDEVNAGRFREDLYYRINVLSLELPPLRSRSGDLQLLVQRFLGDQWQIAPEAMHALEAYHWPGNVRQLINVLERAKILADPPTISLVDLPAELVQKELAESLIPISVPPDHLAAIEQSHVLDILKREGGNKARAARVLGIDRRSLYRLLEKFQGPSAAENVVTARDE
jgi:transcriptional regulator with PAS, ATPase and Fis domain